MIKEEGYCLDYEEYWKEIRCPCFPLLLILKERKQTTWGGKERRMVIKWTWGIVGFENVGKTEIQRPGSCALGCWTCRVSYLTCFSSWTSEWFIPFANKVVDPFTWLPDNCSVFSLNSPCPPSPATMSSHHSPHFAFFFFPSLAQILPLFPLTLRSHGTSCLFHCISLLCLSCT